MLWLQLLSTLSEEERDFVTQLYEKYGDEMYITALNILRNPREASMYYTDDTTAEETARTDGGNAKWLTPEKINWMR